MPIRTLSRIRNELIGYLIVLIVVLVASWSIGSFIAWDWDPAEWSKVTRGVIAFPAVGVLLWQGVEFIKLVT
jgi:hypothetical protein